MIHPSRVTQDDIHGTPNSTVNGIDGWAEKAIAGRGILIDYPSWADEQGIPYDPMTTHGITVDEMNAILAARDIHPRPGDVLFLRTGYVPAYMSLDAAAKESLKTANHSWPGLKQGEAMTRWLWERQFAAIAADNPALECIRKRLLLQLLTPLITLQRRWTWNGSFTLSCLRAGEPRSESFLISRPWRRCVSEGIVGPFSLPAYR